MSVIDCPPNEAPVDPERLTIRYTRSDEGDCVTAQIEEFPAAISQGASQHEAWLNVLDALHDLTHEPTLAERIAFTAQARVVEPLGEMVADFVDAARARNRRRHAH